MTNSSINIFLNTDGVVDFVNGRAGAGMIVRDDQGQFIRAINKLAKFLNAYLSSRAGKRFDC
jgi:hypothetical protein